MVAPTRRTIAYRDHRRRDDHRIPSGVSCTVAETSKVCRACRIRCRGSAVDHGSVPRASRRRGNAQVGITNPLSVDSGALTIGFWQNKNGQGIIKNYCAPATNQKLVEFLRQFAPFQDLSSTAVCANTNSAPKPDLDDAQSYVFDVVKLATCTSSTQDVQLDAEGADAGDRTRTSTSATRTWEGPASVPFNGNGSRRAAAIGGLSVDAGERSVTSDRRPGGGSCNGMYTARRASRTMRLAVLAGHLLATEYNLLNGTPMTVSLPLWGRPMRSSEWTGRRWGDRHQLHGPERQVHRRLSAPLAISLKNALDKYNNNGGCRHRLGELRAGTSRPSPALGPVIMARCGSRSA